MARDRHGHEARWREREAERQARIRPGKRANRNAAKAVERFGSSLEGLAELAGADPCTCGREPDPACPVHCPADEVLARELEAALEEKRRLLDEVARRARGNLTVFGGGIPPRIVYAPGAGKTLAGRQMMERLLAADPHARILYATSELGDPRPKRP